MERSKKVKLLQVVLIINALYFLIAAVAHFFGLTIFPMYDRNLYTPYHDTLLALSDLIFVMIFLTVARDPIKNKDIINTIIVAFLLVIFFNIGIIWKIDFTLLGSSLKRVQTVIETIGAVITLILLIFLNL